MSYYPIFLDLRGRECLVVGGGKIATRKVEGLLRAGAKVTVISLEITETLRAWEQQGKVRHLKRCYQKGDLKDYFLVYGATGLREVDDQMAAEARSEGVLLNVVDHRTLCGFINPAVLQRGNLTIAISTGGKSPGFAKMVRQKLEEFMGQEYGAALTAVAEKRGELRQTSLDIEQRQRLLKEFLELTALDLTQPRR